MGVAPYPWCLVGGAASLGGGQSSRRRGNPPIASLPAGHQIEPASGRKAPTGREIEKQR